VKPNNLSALGFVPQPNLPEIRMAENMIKAENVTNYLKAGGGCGKCLDRIEEILHKTRASMETDSAAD
jgi:NifU-like protein